MKQPHWLVRAVAWVLVRLVQGEVRRGHVTLCRALTYHECLLAGCTQLEALDYVQASLAMPFSLVWRGHELMRTAVKATARPPAASVPVEAAS